MKKYFAALAIALSSITGLVGFTPSASAIQAVTYCPSWENFYYNNQCSGSCEHPSGTCPGNRLCYNCEPWTGNEQTSWVEEARWQYNVYSPAYSWKFEAFAPYNLQYPTTYAVYWKGSPSSGYSMGSVNQYAAYGWQTLVNYSASQAWYNEYAELTDWTGETRQTHRVYADGVALSY